MRPKSRKQTPLFQLQKVCIRPGHSEIINILKSHAAEGSGRRNPIILLLAVQPRKNEVRFQRAEEASRQYQVIAPKHPASKLACRDHLPDGPHILSSSRYRASKQAQQKSLGQHLLDQARIRPDHHPLPAGRHQCHHGREPPRIWPARTIRGATSDTGQFHLPVSGPCAYQQSERYGSPFGLRS